MPIALLLLCGVTFARPSYGQDGCNRPGPDSAKAFAGPYLTDVHETGATIRWEESQPGEPAVRLATQGEPSQTFRGSKAKRISGQGEGPSTAKPAGWLYAVAVSGLKPSQRYGYSVHCGALHGRGGTLVTAPRRGEAYTFVALGDTRSRHADHALVAKAIAGVHPDVLAHTGDMVATGTAEEWQTFFRIEAQLVANSALMAAYGNHESIVGKRTYEAYLPCARPGPPGSHACYYDYGDIRFVLLDTEGPLTQVAWARRILESREGRRAIVLLHRPLLTFSRHPPLRAWRQAFHPVAVEQGVDVVFQGHNHVYERFLLDGVSYVTTGGGGAPRYGLRDHYNPKEGHLRKAAAARLHFVVGRVAAGRITMDVVDVQTGNIIDRFSAPPSKPPSTAKPITR